MEELSRLFLSCDRPLPVLEVMFRLLITVVDNLDSEAHAWLSASLEARVDAHLIAAADQSTVSARLRSTAIAPSTSSC